MSEDEQLAFALNESMTTFTSEQPIEAEPCLLQSSNIYPDGADEEDDIAKAIMLSLTEQGKYC